MGFAWSRSIDDEDERDRETERSSRTTTSRRDGNADLSLATEKNMIVADRGSEKKNVAASRKRVMNLSTTNSQSATKRPSLEKNSNSAEHMDLSTRILMELQQTELECFGDADDDMMEEVSRF